MTLEEFVLPEPTGKYVSDSIRSWRYENGEGRLTIQWDMFGQITLTVMQPHSVTSIPNCGLIQAVAITTHFLD